MTTFSNPPTTDQIIEQLMRSPRLPQIAQHLDELLEAEQERRQQFYADLREDQKAEFINGEVIVQTPVRLQHDRSSSNLFTLFHAFVTRHDLGYVGHEKLLISLTRNDYEPDICYFRDERARSFSDEQIQFPAPDLIVEVLSESTEAVDRGVKFEDYALHGVAEYWIVDPGDESIEQYVLREGAYVLAVKVKTGPIRSAVLDGFEIPVRAVFDPGEHRAALQAIVS